MSLDVYLYRLEDSGIRHTFFDANITHNLGAMADAAGIYDVCWRPDECGVNTARDMIDPLMRGLEWMIRNPGKAREHDAANGWGTYDDFVPWVLRYLMACIAHPDALVRVSR